jgi:hypothetical protein
MNFSGESEPVLSSSREVLLREILLSEDESIDQAVGMPSSYKTLTFKRWTKEISFVSF